MVKKGGQTAHFVPNGSNQNIKSIPVQKAEEWNLNMQKNNQVHPLIFIL
jgi:hypothetical protein